MLHDLDDAQLQLALEFNPSYRVTEDPDSLSEERETVIDLQVLHQMERGVEFSVLHPETHGKDTEETGFDPVKNAAAEPEPVFTDESASSLEDEEDTGWKRALTMKVSPGSNRMELLRESPKEIVAGAHMDLPGKNLTASLKFETISPDSDLFERGSLYLQHARIVAPERKELWRSMRMNRLQNNSV